MIEEKPATTKETKKAEILHLPAKRENCITQMLPILQWVGGGKVKSKGVGKIQWKFFPFVPPTKC